MVPPRGGSGEDRTWLDLSDRPRDEAVFTAYGWDPSMGDEALLAAPLGLSVERAEASASTAIEPDDD